MHWLSRIAPDARTALVVTVLLPWIPFSLPGEELLFSDSFDESSTAERAPNIIDQPPPLGLGYATNVREGYFLKNWIVVDAEPKGPRRSFWVIPILPDGSAATYAEQAGRSRKSIAYAGVRVPASARHYVVEFRQRANDNDTIAFVIGASEPRLSHDGVEISYQRQLPGTDETVPDVYYSSPWGEGVIKDRALMRQWVDHRIEVNGEHLSWSQNGEVMLEGPVTAMPAGGWFGIRQNYERGTRYDDVRIKILDTNESSSPGVAQVTVRFDEPLQQWDGFGVNYVEARHTRDFSVFPQDYGGLKYLDDEERAEVIDLIFGPDGLRPGIVKVFANALMEPENDNDDPYRINPDGFDFESSTPQLRRFLSEGLAASRSWGREPQVLAGLYGPPGWMSAQKTFRGRDLDPAMKLELAEYIGAWAKYLRDEYNADVRYVSMHNEGEDVRRWAADGRDHPDFYHHDYNMWWQDYQVADFLKYSRSVLDKLGLEEVGVSSGETSSWNRFYRYVSPRGTTMSFAHAIRNDPEALANLGLITSHGFLRNTFEPRGVELLRDERPELRAWTTSYSWGDMGLIVAEHPRGFIYQTKVNGLIPWATVHNNYESDKLSPPRGFRVSGNANSPILTNNGVVTITKAYYLYKQLTWAGQPGMRVAQVSHSDPKVSSIAFSGEGTPHADAFALINHSDEAEDVAVTLSGSSNAFEAIATQEYGDVNFATMGRFKVKNGIISIRVLPRSVTTFFSIR